MSTPLFSPDLTVAEALRQGREISRVFVANKTACAGCYLAQFCTLEDVSKIYGFSLEDFLGELQMAAQPHYSTIMGAQNEKQV